MLERVDFSYGKLEIKKMGEALALWDMRWALMNYLTG
jgi:hypothetical protein